MCLKIVTSVHSGAVVISPIGPVRSFNLMQDIFLNRLGKCVRYYDSVTDRNEYWELEFTSPMSFINFQR